MHRLRATKLSILSLLALFSFTGIAWSQGVPDQLQRSMDDLANRKEITARVRAAQSIGNYGSSAAVAVTVLVKRLDTDPVWEVKEACAEALGKIGPPAREALPESLRTALDNKNRDVIIAAARALGEILKGAQETKDMTETVLAFVQQARDSEEVRAAVKKSVALIGSAALPTLLDSIAKGTDAPERRFAVRMLEDSNALSLEQAVTYRRLLEDADGEIGAPFSDAVLNAVQQCTLGGATCLSELPRIHQLEVGGPVDAGLRLYDSGIKVCERYLDSIRSEQGAFGIRALAVRYILPLAAGGLAIVAVLAVACIVLALKGRVLSAKNAALSAQGDVLEGNRAELSRMKNDLEQKIDEISDQKAAKQRNEIARGVLQRFVRMPSVEERPAFKIASAFRDSSDVSGDFYNWSSRSDGSVFIYLVDNEGSSIDAAIQATHTAQLLERILTGGRTQKSPDQLLEDADRVMQRELGQANIAVTMNLVEVHPDHIRLANAGMPAPLLFRHLQAQPQELLAAGVYVGGGYSRFHVLPRLAEAKRCRG